MSEEEIADIEPQESQPEEPSKPALVINVHSWATPVVGLLMLVVGLLAGYFIRPLIPSQAPSETPVAAAPTVSAATLDPNVVSAATEQPANLEEVMDYLVPQIRHVRGDPNATVTMIEFSDFQ